MCVFPIRVCCVLMLGCTAILCLNAEPADAQTGSGTRSRRIERGSAGARSGSRSTHSGSTARRTTTRTFESKLWDYLTRQKYWNWAPVPGQSDGAYPGTSPHGKFLKMYLNRTAAGSPSELPDGSIIIKENYADDGKTLAAITIMYRSKGYNPESGDWYWAKFNPDGTVAMKPSDQAPIRLAGKPNGCIECHGGADGGDFAFFNDTP